MFEIILLLGAILIVVMLVVVFRIYTLMDIIKGSHKKHVPLGNKRNAVLLLFFMIGGLVVLWWYSYTRFDTYTLPIASEHGVLTDRLFWITTAITGAVFIITQILLFYFPYKYQHREHRKPSFYPHNNKLEVVWTVIPAIILSLLIFSGSRLWSKITDTPPEDAEVIEIVGQQFAWKIRYPGKSKQLGRHDYRLIDPVNELGIDLTDPASFDDFVSNVLYLPKGKPVLFQIRSKDVLHSVYLPHFRVKMDAVPGMLTRFWFVPNKTTAEMREALGDPNFDYELACAEVCGRGHFSMKTIVKVETPEAYEQWFAEQKSWLSKNPEYLDQVPEHLKELALISAGMKEKLAVNSEAK